ncbi:Protein of unknown function [Marinospirillum celere]|uniref:DUF3305 domain-containing protein n=1 Tax=Marinospirillum celere TaxID=1122252 RepID=A0A1I1I4E5_9GAMM|nr:DUF3305 domain-containing protein [Marinospirillum celere]SFC28070.1 Protein of unknown function [Marinospirillum celere]
MNRETPSQPSLNAWPLWVRLEKKVGISRGWESITWEVAEISHLPLEHPESVRLELQLFKDLRSAYRFNLSSQNPKLFVVCQETEQGLVPHQISSCQDVAADYMDAGQPVLDIPLPAPIHAWMEAFMAHHGEEDPRAGKRRMRGKPKADQNPQETSS